MLGNSGEIGLGLLGVDLPADIRDIVYDVMHWESTPEHVLQTALDLVGLIPVIGALKNVDEIGTLIKSVAKNADEASGVAQALGKSADDMMGASGEAFKYGDDAFKLDDDILGFGDDALNLDDDLFKLDDDLFELDDDVLKFSDDTAGKSTPTGTETSPPRARGTCRKKPYSMSRPKYGRTQVDEVWNTHANPKPVQSRILLAQRLSGIERNHGMVNGIWDIYPVKNILILMPDI